MRDTRRSKASIPLFALLFLLRASSVCLAAAGKAPPDQFSVVNLQSTSPSGDTRHQLSDATPVRLRFVRAVASSQVIAGEKVPLEVTQAVLVGDLVAIPKGSYAEATVTVAQAKQHMGRGGNLELKVEGVRLADGELAPLRAVKDVKGGGREAAYWLTLSLPIPLNLKGKTASIPEGTEITAYIRGDFPLDASKFQTTGTNPKEGTEPK